LPPGNRHSRGSHGGNRAVHGAEDVIVVDRVDEVSHLADVNFTNLYEGNRAANSTEE
jgi:hypothetical protein